MTRSNKRTPAAKKRRRQIHKSNRRTNRFKKAVADSITDMIQNKPLTPAKNVFVELDVQPVILCREYEKQYKKKLKTLEFRHSGVPN